MPLPLYQPTSTLYDPGAVTVPAVTGASGGLPAVAPAPAVAPTGEIVNVVGPDGRLFGLDKAHLQDAIAKGYRPESAQEAGVREYLEKNKGIGGEIKVALRKIANVPFGGAPDAIDEHAGTNLTRGLGALAMYGLGPAGMAAGYLLGPDPYDKAKTQSLEKAHTVGALAGGGIGMLSQAMMLGGVGGKVGGAIERAILGEGATAAAAADLGAAGLSAGAAAKVAPGVGRSILANAAKYGAEGAVFAAPQVITEASLGDFEHAGETLLLSMGAGAALGTAVGAGSAVLSKLKSAAPVAVGAADAAAADGPGGFLRKFADQKAAKAVAPNNASLRILEKEAERVGGSAGVGRTLHDLNLVKSPFESAEDYARRVIDGTAEKGHAIKALYADAERAGGRIATDGLVSDLRKLEAEVGSQAFHSDVARALKSRIDDFAAVAAKEGETVGLQKAHDWRVDLSNRTNWDMRADDPLTEYGRKMYSVFTKHLETEGERALAAEGKQFIEPLRKANLEFGRLKAAEAATFDYMKREPTLRWASLTDSGAGGAGAVAGAVLHGTFPGAALMGAASTVGHHFLRTEGNAVLARVADALAGGAASRSGVVAAERAIARTGEEMDKIPAWLSKLGLGSKEQIDTLPAAVFSRFLGDTASPKRADKIQAFETLASRLTDLAADPTRLHAQLSEMVHPLTGDAPNVAAAYAAKTAAALQYLQQTMPKDPRPSTMFAGPRPPWRPSDRELADFAKRVAVVENPFAVLQKPGVTEAEMQTLRAVYPKIYQEMVKRIQFAGAGLTGDGSGTQKPIQLTYQQRLRLATLLGSPLDPSLDNTASYQGAFAKASAASGEPGKSAGSKPLKLPQPQTDAQRVLAR